MSKGLRFTVLGTLFICVIQTSVLSSDNLLSFGPLLKLGTGRINSGSLSEAMKRRNQMSTDIKEHDKSAFPGFSFAAGGQCIWHISERWEAEAGIGHSWLRNTIVLEQMEDDAHEGLTARETIRSEAQFTTSSLQLPAAARFIISENKSWYLRLGASLDFAAKTRIESEETVTEEEWVNSSLSSTSIQKNENSADVDEFKSIRTALLMGGGLTIPLGGQSIDLALELSVPLTRSELYTTDFNFTNNTELNEYYSLAGNIDAAQETGIRLDDFRYSAFRLTASYLFGVGRR